MCAQRTINTFRRSVRATLANISQSITQTVRKIRSSKSSDIQAEEDWGLLSDRDDNTVEESESEVVNLRTKVVDEETPVDPGWIADFTCPLSQTTHATQTFAPPGRANCSKTYYNLSFSSC